MAVQTRALDPAAGFEVEERDVVYRRDGATEWLARVSRPREAGVFPALLDVHGRAWNQGTREQNAPIDRPLAASGMVVAAIDFRLAPAHPYPASLQDVNYAARWLKAHAVELGAGADRLGALGSSSGGHQVVLAALRPHDPRYAALPLPEAPGVDASFAYGDADANIPVAIVERFAAAHRARGGRVETAVSPASLHGFGNRGGPDAQRAIEQIESFIAEQLHP